MLAAKSWRLNNLYKVLNPHGKVVPFRLKWQQQHYLEHQHGRDILLKARQVGFSTLIDLDYLDDCLFIPNLKAAIVADTLDNARKLLREKVYLPFDHLPKELAAALPKMTERNAESCAWDNGSRFEVGVSLRGGTVQDLHISELGKVAIKHPEKAREIRTGALNTVHAGGKIAVESTGMGQDGVFYDMCDNARGLVDPSQLDFVFHFFPWWYDPTYQLDHRVHIGDAQAEYFAKLAAEGIPLSTQQKAWYVVKAREQGPDMKREYPSTPEEAFESTLEGTYYSTQMARMLEEGRITTVPLIEGKPVHTFWDIGNKDATAIVFAQFIGEFVHIIDYYENSGEQIDHYLQVLRERGYDYGMFFMPHDIRITVWGMNKTRIEQFVEAGIEPNITPNIAVQDGINAARSILDYCIVDAANCERLLRCLRNYRKQWDEKKGRFRDKPLHDWASDGADAFRYLAVVYDAEYGREPVKVAPEDNHNITGVKVEEMMLKRTRRGDAGRIA